MCAARRGRERGATPLARAGLHEPASEPLLPQRRQDMHTGDIPALIVRASFPFGQNGRRLHRGTGPERQSDCQQSAFHLSCLGQMATCLFYFLVKSFRRKHAARPPGVPWIWMSSRGQPPSMRLKRRRLRCLAWSGRSAPRALPQDDLEAAPPHCPRLPGSSPQGSSAFAECPPAPLPQDQPNGSQQQSPHPEPEGAPPVLGRTAAKNTRPKCFEQR